MLLADISSTAYALFSVIIALSGGILGATWRIGNKVGSISTTQTDHDRRIDDLEAAVIINGRVQQLELHQREHDLWHMNRGDR